MVTKKLVKSPPKTGCEEALLLARNLLKIIQKKDEWNKGDEKNLVRLSKIVGILSKLAPLEKKVSKNLRTPTPKEDAAIIKRMLARKK